jgi:putative ABC transport system permease protein
LVRYCGDSYGKIAMYAKDKYHQPPRLSEWLLKCLFPDHRAHTLAGDLSETYQFQFNQQGPFRAKWWYRGQLLKALLPLIDDIIYWRSAMFKNYLKTALRNIRKHTIYSFINISGLAIGMACCFFIFLWVKNELSYDRFHEKTDRIHRVIAEHFTEGRSDLFPATPAPLAQALMDGCPEVEQALRIEDYNDIRLANKNKQFWGNRGLLTDPNFFDVFSFPLIKGNPHTALTSIDSIVITEAVAHKCFGEEEPLDQVLTLGSRNPRDYRVTGVLKDIPKNSHLQFDFLLSFSIITYNLNWSCWNYMTYVLLSSPETKPAVETKSSDLLIKIGKPNFKLHLQPVAQIHLHSSFRVDVDTNGKIAHVYLFSVMGIMLILLACINFVNLCTARSALRQKEVGVRKVVGASRRQLIKQFIGESVFLSFLAFLISIVLLKILLPYFNTLLNQDLSFSLFHGFSFLLLMAGLALVVGLLSGIYPAYIISAFHPKQTISGGFTRQGTRHSARLRKSLVVTQFAISILFITSSLFVRNQLHYISNKDLGYEKNHLVILPFEKVMPAYRGVELGQRQESLKTELLQNVAITNATFSSYSLNRSCAHQSVWWEGKTGEDILMDWISVDYDFFKTMEIKFKEGRPFSRKFPTDPKMAYILNESAVKKTGWSKAEGRQFQIPGPRKIGTVVGVVNDFNYKSLHTEIQPLVITLGRTQYYMIIRIRPDNLPSTLAYMKKKWNEFFPGQTFEYSFLDEDFDRVYRSEIQMGKVFNTIAGLAVFIACLGLFGLVSFAAERRTKEIGIRKVLGASLSRIAVLIAKEPTGCIVLANLIAWPIAWYAMSRWSQNFAYRAPITLWPFLISGGLAILVALLTMSIQILRAASANPVDSLRYE